jgi:hypothetical protein
MATKLKLKSKEDEQAFQAMIDDRDAGFPLLKAMRAAANYTPKWFNPFAEAASK